MASRKEQKERLRQERMQREQEAAAAAARRKRMGYGVAGVLVAAVVIAVAAIALAGGGSSSTGTSDTRWPSGSIPRPGRGYEPGVREGRGRRMRGNQRFLKTSLSPRGTSLSTRRSSWPANDDAPERHRRFVA